VAGQGRVLSGTPDQAALGDPAAQAKLLSPVLPGLSVAMRKPINSSKSYTGGVPFGIEAVNVPLWGNYAALMDPF
jgi:hypothetical protein